MHKKDIKAIFKEIRSGSLDKVKALIADKPELIHACNFAPPKKDEGQSTLQVALKTGNFKIARFLIEQGADVNFIEKSEVNDWNAPVLHDCIRAVIFNSYTLNKEQLEFEEGLSILKILLNSGADLNSVDSYGNNCLHRAILDSNQMINNPSANLKDGVLLIQLRNLFDVLLTAGAEPKAKNDKRPSAIDFIKAFGLDEYQLLKC